MSHQVERCDFIDMLEESAKFHRTIAVTLKANSRFSDKVRDVVTEDGTDYAIFHDHGRVPLSDILDCAWKEALPASYDSKL